MAGGTREGISAPPCPKPPDTAHVSWTGIERLLWSGCCARTESTAKASTAPTKTGQRWLSTGDLRTIHILHPKGFLLLHSRGSPRPCILLHPKGFLIPRDSCFCTPRQIHPPASSCIPRDSCSRSRAAPLPGVLILWGVCHFPPPLCPVDLTPYLLFLTFHLCQGGAGIFYFLKYLPGILKPIPRRRKAAHPEPLKRSPCPPPLGGWGPHPGAEGPVPGQRDPSSPA